MHLACIFVWVNHIELLNVQNLHVSSMKHILWAWPYAEWGDSMFTCTPPTQIMTFTTAAAHKLRVSMWPRRAATHACRCAMTARTHSRNAYAQTQPDRVSSPVRRLSSASSFSPFVTPPFPPSLLSLRIKGEQLHNNSRHDSQTLTLHIMEREVLGSLRCESHKSEHSAPHEEHDGAEMKQGVFVATGKCEISHLSSELRVSELLQGWTQPEKRESLRFTEFTTETDLNIHK